MSTNNHSFYGNYTRDYDISGEIDKENDDSLPNELTEMSESSKYCVFAYCILFVIATSGNLTVLFSVYKQYKVNKSRITLLILHLSIADLIVCSTLIPTEVFWRVTIQWRGGNVLCKGMQFLRAFGLHLSSMVLICAILFSLASHPQFPSFRQCVTNEFLKNTNDVRMCSIFSVSAMYFAPLLVILFTYTAILIKIIRKARQNHQPVQTKVQQQQHQSTAQKRQFIRFRLSAHQQSTNSTENCHNLMVNTQHHPIMKQQNNSRLSVTMSSQDGQKPYSISSGSGDNSSEPSCSSITCSTINLEGINGTTIHSTGGDSTRDSAHKPHHPNQSKSSHPQSPKIITYCKSNSHSKHVVLRRSENAAGQMSRAKKRTLVMTIVIVVMFVLCWTPYVVMTLWYMFDWEGAKKIDPRIQDGLFVMAVANSCVNPLIYGSFTKRCCGLSKLLGRLRPTGGQ